MLLSPLSGSAATVEDLLKIPILNQDQPLAEVQAFTERRVPILLPPRNREEWEDTSKRIRRQVLDQVVFRGEARHWRDTPLKVEWLDSLDGGPGYRIRKLRYQALPGWWIPALLYEPLQLSGVAPVVLNVNGHDGAGKAADYKQIRCINQAKRGMIALNPEWIGMGQLRGESYQHYRMNQLNLCGTSGLAPFYLAMERALDLLLSLPNADPQRVAVTGLSGGGWQTIFISSLDPRVTLANPVAGYSSFRTRARHLEDLGDSEQTPCDLAQFADYTHLTALLAPRPALLTFNASDNCCFASTHALSPLFTAAAPFYRLYGQPDHLRAHVNHDPGTHNFGLDNRVALYRMFSDFFDPNGQTTALEFSAEIKTADRLQVPLPEPNANFNTLSTALSRPLPRLPAPDAASPQFEDWVEGRRVSLASTIRLPATHLRAHPVAHTAENDLQSARWRLRINDEWTVPAVELARPDAKGIALLLADDGRQAAAAEVTRLLADGWRVVAIDPFYFGESGISRRDFLFALLVDSVGERNLGIQTSQVIAIAGWFRERYPDGALRLVASGPRTSTIALAAAALAHDDIDEVELHDPLRSLKQLIDENWPVTKAPELFCFGLLEEFDIEQLKLLCAGRMIP